jgi:hypothetical protein
MKSSRAQSFSDAEPANTISCELGIIGVHIYSVRSPPMDVTA